MHSSISSSDQPIPSGSWGKTWLLTLVLVVLGVGGWEVAWRTRGLEPGPENAADLWALNRSRVQSNSLVLVGTSRIMVDLDRDEVARKTGRTPIQLGMFASSALPVLEELAEDESFAGTIVVDFVPRLVFDGTAGSEANPREYLEAYRLTRSSPARKSEIRLRLLAQSHFVFLKGFLSPLLVVRKVFEGNPPGPELFRVGWDRFPAARLSPGRQIVPAELYAGNPAEDEEFTSRIRRLRDAVARIRGRGGRLLFVYLPTSGIVKEREERAFPRGKYWDPLAQMTGARTIHADDYPQLAHFTCPDGSHLAAADAPLFTAALLGIWLEESDGQVHTVGVRNSGADWDQR